MPRLAVLPDYLKPGLDAVFVGTAVGIRSAAVGGYYAGRGNQFWELLYRSGLTPVRLSPDGSGDILAYGLDLTDLAKRRASSRDAELLREGLRRGGVHRQGRPTQAPLGSHSTGRLRRRSLAGTSAKAVTSHSAGNPGRSPRRWCSSCRARPARTATPRPSRARPRSSTGSAPSAGACGERRRNDGPTRLPSLGQRRRHWRAHATPPDDGRLRSLRLARGRGGEADPEGRAGVPEAPRGPRSVSVPPGRPGPHDRLCRRGRLPAPTDRRLSVRLPPAGDQRKDEQAHEGAPSGRWLDRGLDRDTGVGDRRRRDAAARPPQEKAGRLLVESAALHALPEAEHAENLPGVGDPEQEV